MTSSSTSARAFGDPIDLGVAALSAVSVGFLAYAMPEALFSSLVSATHLPDLVAAAAPPLGTKARFAVMAGGGALAFLLVWSLLRALGGAAPSAAAPQAEKEEVDPDAPRLRRADAHPDAPARRPIFAGAEFGEPESDIFELDNPEPFAGRHQPLRRPEMPAAPEAATEAEPAQIEPAGRLPRFLVPEAPEPPIERSPLIPSTQKRSFDALSARLPEAPEPAGDSIGSLMNRLERGLVEREEPGSASAREAELPPPLAAAASDPDMSLPPEGVRHRLRSAISELNQRAGRG